MTVAQLVIAPVVLPEFVPVANDTLFDVPSVRKDGGFGSTGDY
jgi:dUTPase